jgi:hypothetical protein
MVIIKGEYGHCAATICGAREASARDKGAKNRPHEPQCRRQWHLTRYATHTSCTPRRKRSRRATEGGRGDWIRTSDLLLPKQALCHAELRPDRFGLYTQTQAQSSILAEGARLARLRRVKFGLYPPEAGSDLLLPKQALCHAELRPDRPGLYTQTRAQSSILFVSGHAEDHLELRKTRNTRRIYPPERQRRRENLTDPLSQALS